MSSVRLLQLIILMMAAGAIAGCESETTFAIEREVPAPMSLPGVSTLGVTAFVGSGGEAVAVQIERALTKGGAFRSVKRVPVPEGRRDDTEIARAAQDAGVDALVIGNVQGLEVSRTLEAATLITKRINGQPTDVPTTRRLKTGHLSITFRLVGADRLVATGPAIDKDLRFERTEDPLPHLTTLEPKEFPRDPIPTDDELATRLAAEAATDVARAISPRREPVVVTWEDAGDADRQARPYFEAKAYGQAASSLRTILGDSSEAGTLPEQGELKPRNLSVTETAHAFYDLGLCEDALGDYARADRHLDRALTLEDSERHLAALRDLRRREETRR